METQKIKIGSKAGYENPKDEFKIGHVKDIKNGKALFNSRWCNLSNLVPITSKTPRYIRVYDNGGETYDRYTILFTKKRIDGHFMCLGVSHDLSVGSHFDTTEILDYPVSSHLGKRIKFEHLPEKVRNLVLDDYKDIWGITDKKPKLNLFK